MLERHIETLTEMSLNHHFDHINVIVIISTVVTLVRTDRVV